MLVLGWLAFILNVFGNLMLARLNIWGWLVRIVTNIAWIAYAVQVEHGAPMWANHAAFMLINIYGFRNWRVKTCKWCKGDLLLCGEFGRCPPCEVVVRFQT